MATLHHQSYHHHSSSTTSSRRPRHSLDNSSLSFKPRHRPATTAATTISLSSTTATTTFSAAATTATTPATTADTGYSLDALERHLAAANFRQADEETRRLLIVLAGEAAIKRGYVFFSEVQFIPKEDLKAIDELWRKYSDEKFGYSVQRKIWLKANKDFTNFFIKVGWMKKLDTEIEQYNYRAFPNEFMWELNPPPPTSEEEGAEENNKSKNNNNSIPPLGHLPLTNALRGTQLLNCIFTHPAFADEDDIDGEKRSESDEQQTVVDEVDKKKSRLASLRDKLFKPNYSF